MNRVLVGEQMNAEVQRSQGRRGKVVKVTFSHCKMMDWLCK